MRWFSVPRPPCDYDYVQGVPHNGSYWPEFGAHGKDKATMYDAITHRLGVPIMPLGVTPELMCDWDWMVQRIADMHARCPIAEFRIYILIT